MTASSDTDSAGLRNDAPSAISMARRVVVKIGSALLIAEDGVADRRFLTSLAADVSALRAAGKEIVLVTSGAVAIGRGRLGLWGGLRLDESQAASAAGQAHLINAWQEALAPHDVVAAQVLLTLSDMEDRRRYLNARATLSRLLALGALPVVNENDTVATAEIRYGDNDRLAAHTAQLTSADLLILLSDVDGLYTADPRKEPSARHIGRVDRVDASIEAMAGGRNENAAVGSGGMATKLAAARIAAGAGAATLIGSGGIDRPIAAIARGARATYFAPATTPERARKTWIRNALSVAGRLEVDAGAARALVNGSSLLPAGVLSVSGEFGRGDLVEVTGADGAQIAKGLTAYDAAEARIAARRKSAEIDELLGYRRRAAMIDRDDLVLLRSEAGLEREEET